MEIYTAGFTRWTARDFFGALGAHGVRRIVDVRLNNTSQLSAFAKRDDLTYFAEQLIGASYVHEASLAPTSEMLKAYRAKELSWAEYEQLFLDLVETRAIESTFEEASFETPTVLLCSEHGPECCHRRLVAEYLGDHWSSGLQITHI